MAGSVRLVMIGTLVMMALAGCRHGTGRVSTAEAKPAGDVVEERWPNGRLRMRAEVVRGGDGEVVYDGAFGRWCEDGAQEYEASFVRGKLHGVETAWHKNGQKCTEQHYKHGLRHGPRYAWDEGGRKRKEEHYVRDKPHGTWTVWDTGGRIKWQQSFDRGTPLPQP